MYGLRNEFPIIFYYGLIGYTLLWAQQKLRNDIKCVSRFPDLSRTFGPAKLVAGPDLRCLCSAGPAVWEPLWLDLDSKEHAHKHTHTHKKRKRKTKIPGNKHCKSVLNGKFVKF